MSEEYKELIQTIYSAAGYPLFLIYKDQPSIDVSFSFKVYEVGGIYEDGEIEEGNFYLNGCIKWDGCSHLWFGDKDGYLHLCGEDDWINHKVLMDALWQYAKENIAKWDNEAAK